MLNWISEPAFWTIFLILHGLSAVALLGALTHQALAAFKDSARSSPDFIGRFTSVHSAVYTKAICILWIVTFVLGGFIYAKYRIAIRIPLEASEFWWTQGFFELKENWSSIGLLLLPAYYCLWQAQLNESLIRARNYLTGILAIICWFTFLVGHVVNNTRGFGS
ncbi:MAG: hypothetical protein WCK52_04470 [Betaproteobacteria bacterium]|jgi:hypothetical protein